MPVDSSNTALSRIASLLGDQQAREKATTGSTKYPGAPVDTIQPVPQPVDPLQRQKQELSAQMYYSMRVLPITPALLFDMEAHLPGVVAFLASLHGRPAARAAFMTMIDSTKQRPPNSERSDRSQDRLLALSQSIAEEAFGEEIQRNPALVAAGIAVAAAGLFVASGMAGYTIAHNWPK